MAPILRAAKLLFVAVMAMTFSACVPSGEQDVNTELFKNKEELAERADKLKTGMSRKAVFETLGIGPDRFERMSSRDVQMCIYGNAQVQGSPEQLENFKKKLMSYEGYSLPYREIKASSSLGFGTMKVEKTGHDLRLVLLFQGGRLISSSVEGTHQVKQEEEEYMWGTLIRRGLGAAF